MRSGVLTSISVDSAAQLAAAQCPNERTSDPQFAARQILFNVAPAGRTVTFTPAMFYYVSSGT